MVTMRSNQQNMTSSQRNPFNSSQAVFILGQWVFGVKNRTVFSNKVTSDPLSNVWLWRWKPSKQALHLTVTFLIEAGKTVSREVVHPLVRRRRNCSMVYPNSLRPMPCYARWSSKSLRIMSLPHHTGIFFTLLVFYVQIFDKWSSP